MRLKLVSHPFFTLQLCRSKYQPTRSSWIGTVLLMFTVHWHEFILGHSYTTAPRHTQVKSITGRLEPCSQSLPSFCHFCDSLLACEESLGMQQLAKGTRSVTFTTIFQTACDTTIEGLSFQFLVNIQISNHCSWSSLAAAHTVYIYLCTLTPANNILPSCWLAACVNLISPALPDVCRHTAKLYNSHADSVKLYFCGVCVGVYKLLIW